MFHRYHYYVLARPRILDSEFDRMHNYFLSLFPHSSILNSVGSDDARDYPLYIVRGYRPGPADRR